MEMISPNLPAHPVMSWPREFDCYITRFLFIWISYLSVTLLSPPKLRRQQESAVSSSNSQQDELKDAVLQQQPHSTPALTCLSIFSQARWHGLQKAQPVPEILQGVCHISDTQSSELPRLISFMPQSGRCLWETRNEARTSQIPNVTMCERTAGSQVITTKKEKNPTPPQKSNPKDSCLHILKRILLLFSFSGTHVHLKNKQRRFYSHIPIGV